MYGWSQVIVSCHKQKLNLKNDFAPVDVAYFVFIKLAVFKLSRNLRSSGKIDDKSIIISLSDFEKPLQGMDLQKKSIQIKNHGGRELAVLIKTARFQSGSIEYIRGRAKKSVTKS